MVKKMRSKMKGASYNVGGRDWAKLFREQDKDHSGHISVDEFLSMCRRVLKLTKDEAPEKTLKMVFRSLDEDQSGEVSVEELVAFVDLERIQARLRGAAQALDGEHGWADLFRQQDTDGSGQIDWDEFLAMCRNVLNLNEDEACLRAVFR